MLVSESLRRLWSTKCHRPLFLPTLHCSFKEGSGVEVRIPIQANTSQCLTSHRMKHGTVTLQQWTAKASESFNVPPKSCHCHHTFNPFMPWLVVLCHRTCGQWSSCHLLALRYQPLNQTCHWQQRQSEWCSLGEAVLTSTPGLVTVTEEML